MALPPLDSWDDVAAHLRSLRTAAGQPSFSAVTSLVSDLRSARRPNAPAGAFDAPGRSTIHDCFQSGRTRMDLELLADLGEVLGLSGAQGREWQEACFRVQNRLDSSKVVSVSSERYRSPYFVGREIEISELVEARGVWCLSGLPGVGKTQLALRVADAWVADGTASRVLVADLRGYHDTRPPADGTAIAAELVRTLSGKSPTSDPRSQLPDLLRERRCIVVLDDAATSDQVVAALPDDLSTPVLITSRKRLGLTAASHFAVRPLDHGESIELLARHVGSERVAADATAAKALVASLGGLAVALDVAARRIAASPEWTLTDHQLALSEQARMLRVPEGVESELALSYSRLSPLAALLLRALAEQPGASYSVEQCAILANVSHGVASSGIDELLAAHLASRPEDTDRLHLHSLVRMFAAARAIAEDPPSARGLARERLLKHYLERASAAVTAAGLSPLVSRRAFAANDDTGLTKQAAQDWLGTERENLIAHADEDQCKAMPSYPIRLSVILSRALEVWRRVEEGRHLHGLALRAAIKQGDQSAHARALIMLGNGTYASTPEPARTQFTQAMALVDPATDPETMISALNGLGGIAFHAGDLDTAETFFTQAVEITKAPGVTRSAGGLLSNLGAVKSHKGDFAGAREQHLAACEACRASNDLEGLASSLCNLSDVYSQLGDYEAAREVAEECVRIAESINSRTSHVVGRINLADALGHLGRPDEALSIYRSAVEDAGAHGHPVFEAGGLIGIAELLQAQGDLLGARQAFEASGEVSSKHSLGYWFARHLLGLGDLDLLAGRNDEARAKFERAVATFAETGAREAEELQARLDSLPGDASGEVSAES